MTGAFLEVENLSKTFGGSPSETLRPSVDGVSFTLDKAQSLAIVGESGSGKTTIARMLVGLERPSSGSIRVDGQERTSKRQSVKMRRLHARQLQMVFQDPYSSLDPRQSAAAAIGELVALHTDLDGVKRGARVSELLEQVGLDERQGRSRPRDLSGGQRQRVAIARALAAEPTVLVLDEAVAALDVSVQAQVLNLLADIQEATGVAYLFISHDLAVVRQVTDRTLVLRRGQCVEEGPTGELLDAPRHSYTRALRDSIPRPGWRPSRQQFSTLEE
jgi:oligopeptide transport system ATP-binding protein